MDRPASLGAYLTRCREAAGLSAEEISARTRIVPRLIRALETDRRDDLPATVYVRGFIRAYCEHVGVGPDEALALFEAAERTAPPVARAAGPPPGPARPPRSTAPPSRRRPLAVGTAVAVLVVASLGVALYQVGAVWRPHLAATREPPPPAGPAALPLRAPALGAAPASDDSAAASPEAAAATSPAEAGATPDAEPAPAEPPAGGTGAPRVLVMRADDTTWVRVKPEDERATEATLAPGSVREWRSAGRFTVTLGNAGGVRLELDGKPLPALGSRGEVVRDVVIPPEAPRPEEAGS